MKKNWDWYYRDMMAVLTYKGEDYWFCRLAREAGFEVWIDLTVKVLHIGDHLF